MMATSPRLLNTEKQTVTNIRSQLVLTQHNKDEQRPTAEGEARRSDITQPEKRYLSSWKAIAQYIGVSLRTVQRWERSSGLPVRRPGGNNTGTVVAIAAEIDDWILNIPTSVRAVHGERESSKGGTIPADSRILE